MGWKNKFIHLFIDMMGKICEDFQEDWDNKKKVEVGWRVMKALTDKAINTGIKPPKI